MKITYVAKYHLHIVTIATSDVHDQQTGLQSHDDNDTCSIQTGTYHVC